MSSFDSDVTWNPAEYDSSSFVYDIYFVQELDNQWVLHFFSLCSEIWTDRESKNVMNFLCLLTAIRFKAKIKYLIAWQEFKKITVDNV